MANQKLTGLMVQIEEVTLSVVGAIERFDEMEMRSIETKESVEKSLDSTKESVLKVSRNVGESLDGVESKTITTSETIEGRVSQVSDSVAKSGEEINTVLDELLNSSATVIDDLQASLEGATGPFNEDLRGVLELVELGILRVNEIDKAYLDAEINGTSLRELLEGFDLRKFEDDIRNLSNEMKKGRADIGNVLEFLTERGGELGKSITDWVKKFQGGQITVGKFRSEIALLLRELEKVSGGDATDLQALLDAVGDLIENDSATS